MAADYKKTFYQCQAVRSSREKKFDLRHVMIVDHKTNFIKTGQKKIFFSFKDQKSLLKVWLAHDRQRKHHCRMKFCQKKQFNNCDWDTVLLTQ